MPRTIERMNAEPALARFVERYPEYSVTGAIDRLRAADYGRLDRDGHIYLDYTGGSLYAESQVRDHAELLAAGVFGNPHSGSLSSTASTTLVERARRRVLEFFHAPPSTYTAVFTQNATAALKLVGESYPFAAGSRFLLPFDNHNSVNGIREFARARGAAVDYAPLTLPDLRLDRDDARRAARRRPAAAPQPVRVSRAVELLGRAASARARRARRTRSGWDVLLDAAAFVPTNRLDLEAVQPDFVDVSFYKMFGYPTGVGCLLVRDATRSRGCGGRGSPAARSTSRRCRAARTSCRRGEAGFEDGTLQLPEHPGGGDRPAAPGARSASTRSTRACAA